MASGGPTGGTCELPTRKAEALLAYLACHPGEKQPRDRLTALLWGDRGDKQARHSLSQTLLSLRQELGEANSLLLIERESVALRADAVETDVLEFRRLATTPGGLRAALDLYRGPFLDGFSLREPGFEDWLIEQRARLQGIAFGTFLALADAQTRGRRLERRHVDAEQRHPVDPLAEEAYRRLMTLQIEQGLCNDAIRNYRTLADALRRELKTQPDPSTTAIYQRATARPQQSAQPQGLSEPGGEIDIVAAERVEPGQREATGPRRASIAIMPFVDLRRRTAGQAAASRDGLSHDLITRLAKLRSVFVIAQGTVFALAERGVGAEEAGRMLNVDYVACGTLRRDGRVSVAVELAETRSARIIWADTIEASSSDSLAARRDRRPDRRVRSRRRSRLAERNRAILKPPSSLDAWEALAPRPLAHVPLQRARTTSGPSSSSSWRVRLDPTFARAYAGLSFTHFQNAFLLRLGRARSRRSTRPTTWPRRPERRRPRSGGALGDGPRAVAARRARPSR